MSLGSNLSIFGDRTAVVTADGQETSYRALEQRVAHWAEQLPEPRRLMLLEADNSVDFIAIYLACMRQRHPVVLTAPGRPAVAEQIRNVLNVGGHLRHTDGGYRYEDLGDSGELHPDLCVILSTSGSTGSAKFVRLSRDNIEANARSIAEYLQIGDSDRAATSLPPYYSYGLSVINSHLLNGASLLLTNDSVAEDSFWTAFAERQCTSFAGVPHTFKILSRRGFTGSELSSLRYVTQAGGRLEPGMVTWMATLARDHRFEFFVMYGQTEATARMSYLPHELALEHPDSVGIAIPGGAFRIVDEQGRQITAADTPGELVYSGPNVMMGYAQQAADLALGPSLDELRTGDLARRSEAGLHYIVGRKSRFLKLFGLRVNLDDVEGFVRERGFDAIATGSDDRLLLLLHGSEHESNLAEAVSAWLEVPQSAVAMRFVDEFPVLSSGKIDYQRAKALFDRPGDDAPSIAASVESVFRRNLALDSLDPTESFATLGGDSLTYVQMSVDLEALLGALPANWSSMPVSELQGMSKRTARWPGLDTTIVVRALSIFLIVAVHLELWNYGGGGAYLLLMVAGLNFRRFQVSAIEASDSVRPILDLAVRVVAPTVAYLLLLQTVFHQFSPAATLLVSNFVGPEVNEGFSYWFIEVYVQLLLLLALVLSVRAIRTLVASERFPVDMTLLLVAFGISLAGPLLWNTDDLYNRVPHMMLVLFMLGWCIAAAASFEQRAVLCAVALLVCAVNYSFSPLLVGGTLLLLWVRTIPMPALLRPAVSSVAGASLFIYLTHFQFRSAAKHLYGGTIPLVDVALALLGGVAVWWVYTRVTREGARIARGILAGRVSSTQ